MSPRSTQYNPVLVAVCDAGEYWAFTSCGLVNGNNCGFTNVSLRRSNGTDTPQTRPPRRRRSRWSERPIKDTKPL